MLWTKMPTIEAIQHSLKNTLCEQLGMKFTEVGDDFLIAQMPVDHRTHQPAGLLHGGASVALAESLGSIASFLCIPSPDQMPVGVEINANHLRSVTEGFVYGKVTAIKVGRTLHVWNIEIKNDADQLVCVSRLSVMIVPRPTGKTS
ncbi:MAG: hotdog fold thioesterase [Proteobacteria bacterium]|nr:MAG: hotdog fold thioesterase [Pseudomonadota bacterium]